MKGYSDCSKYSTVQAVDIESKTVTNFYLIRLAAKVGVVNEV